LNKPRIFVGSSKEALDVAYSIQESLEHDAEVTVWTQGIFGLSRYTMESLVDALNETDFGMFVFQPDDVTVMRKATVSAVRDNVIFELGMFIGRLQRNRCFIVVPRRFSSATASACAAMALFWALAACAWPMIDAVVPTTEVTPTTMAAVTGSQI